MLLQCVSCVSEVVDKSASSLSVCVCVCLKIPTVVIIYLPSGRESVCVF